MEINKQLLDEVFVISELIKVEVRVISRSRRLMQPFSNETEWNQLAYDHPVNTITLLTRQLYSGLKKSSDSPFPLHLKEALKYDHSVNTTSFAWPEGVVLTGSTVLLCNLRLDDVTDTDF